MRAGTDARRLAEENAELRREVDSLKSALGKLCDEYEAACGEADKALGGGVWAARAETWRKVLSFAGIG